jgi:hypothetical protein
LAKFTAHTAVHGEQGPVFFEPGDTVPAWAADKVGDHVTDGGKVSAAKAETVPDDDADESETGADDTEAPDFTTAKPRQTRTRRK